MYSTCDDGGDGDDNDAKSLTTTMMRLVETKKFDRTGNQALFMVVHWQQLNPRLCQYPR